MRYIIDDNLHRVKLTDMWLWQINLVMRLTCDRCHISFSTFTDEDKQHSMALRIIFVKQGLPVELFRVLFRWQSSNFIVC